MTKVKKYVSGTLLLFFLLPLALADLADYNQDFEGLDQTSPEALSGDGWLVFANVFSGEDGAFLYGYGPFGAPNGGPAFSAIAIEQGGQAQGAQQLVVYSDYNNGDHGNGNLVEANVYREQTIGAQDVGKTYSFRFDAKRGDIGGNTTAIAFIKTLDPNNNFQQTNFLTFDTTALPVTWASHEIAITIDESLVGQLLQIGFASSATNYETSGNYYDNIVFGIQDTTDTDGDGLPDVIDPDDDNDGVPDELDDYPLGRFADARPGHWAFSFIEALARSGITAGCGGDNYCPTAAVTRAQMAVFLERGINGSDFVPPAASGGMFLDVDAGDFAANFIEQLFADGITSGCGGGNYCPDDSVTRAQMAVFLLRSKYGAGYIPPAPAGIFDDVPTDYFAAAWVEQLAAEGITSGCGGGNYCPDAEITREQMAVFLVRAFGLL
jgi:hypothetical protein